MKQVSSFVFVLAVVALFSGCSSQEDRNNADTLRKGVMVHPSQGDESFVFVESKELSLGSKLKIAIVRREKDGAVYQAMVDSAKEVKEGDKVELLRVQYQFAPHTNHGEKFYVIK